MLNVRRLRSLRDLLTQTNNDTDPKNSVTKMNLICFMLFTPCFYSYILIIMKMFIVPIKVMTPYNTTGQNTDLITNGKPVYILIDQW